MTTMLADRFADAERRRVESLDDLRACLSELENREVKREEFCELLSLSLRILELDHDAAATLLMTSRPTISRWVSGHSAPHRLGRPAVFRALRKVAAERLRQHGAQSR